MNKTKNYNLHLPDDDDFYDIHQTNENTNIIDTELAKNEKHAKEESVLSENGVHGLRYFNEEMQVFNGEKWIEVENKYAIQFKIKTESGSTVHATDGINTITGISVNGTCLLEIPNYGDWNFYATLGEAITDTTTITVDTIKIYELELLYFRHNITYTSNGEISLVGHTLVATDGVNTLTKTVTDANDTTLTVYNVGDWTCFIKKDGFTSEPKVKSIQIAGTTVVDSKYKILHIHIDDDFSRITEYKCTVNGVNYAQNENESGDIITQLLPQNTTSAIVTLTKDLYYEQITYDITSFVTHEQTLPFTKIYGFKIDLSNPDPTASVTYIMDATGMTPGSDSWVQTDIFKDIKPFRFTSNSTKEGVYVNPNDFSKDLDGNDIPSGVEKTMIEFPRIGLRVEKNIDNLKIYLTRNPNNPNFKYNAFKRGTVDKEYMYLGAYLTYIAWYSPYK